jgi:hypothetical protein
MMIAQTGLTTSSLPDSTSTVSSSGDTLSWLIPVGIGVFLTVLLLRLTRVSTKNPSSTKETKGPKTTNGKSRETSLESSKDDSSGVTRERSSGRSGGSKKNKKNRNNRSNERVVSATITGNDSSEKVTEKVVAKSKKERLREQQIAYAEAAAPVTPSSSQVSAPVNPIFEPLRDVGALRRSVQTAKSATSEENQFADKTPAVQPSSGRFERIISSTVTTQSSANRWPAPAMQTPPRKPFATSESEISKPESKPEKPSNSSDIASIAPQTEASPRQGLKSFVSKVKSASASSAVVTDVAD